MQKTKLGVSVGLLGAAVYFAALFGGYVPVFLLAGYALLFEENEWLKKACIKAVAVMMSFAVLVTLIGLIPDVLGWLASFFSIFRINFSYSFISSIIGVITGAISIIKTVLFLLLGIKALTQGTVNVPFVDKLIDKYMGQ